jgi:hypothetical protein
MQAGQITTARKQPLELGLEAPRPLLSKELDVASVTADY